LEGFDGQPPAITCMDPLLDFDTLKGVHGSKKMQKKAFRMMLQTLTGAEALAFFMDVHQEPEDVSKAQLESTRSALEVAEIVLSEIVKQMARLAISCRLVLVPQKWIGSSVALAFDAGQVPARTVPEAEVRAGVKVNIFDWGRSELNDLEKHEKMSSKDRQDRAKFWCFYVGGIDRLAFEAARLYHNRFGNADEWSEFLCVVNDFDSMSASDCLGMVEIPIKETAETTLTLRASSGKEVKAMLSSKNAASITYSLEYRTYPSSSRLKGCWRFNVIKANNLPGKDMKQLKATSDPYVELVASAKVGNRIFRQQTTCKPRCLDASWGETLEVPVVRDADQLEATLQSVSPALTKRPISKFMCPEAAALAARAQNAASGRPRSSTSVLLSDEQQALEGWQSALDGSVENLETLEDFFRGGSSSSTSNPAAGEATTTLSSSETLKDMQEVMNEMKRLRSGTSTESLKEVADMSPAKAAVVNESTPVDIPIDISDRIKSEIQQADKLSVVPAVDRAEPTEVPQPLCQGQCNACTCM